MSSTRPPAEAALRSEARLVLLVALGLALAWAGWQPRLPAQSVPASAQTNTALALLNAAPRTNTLSVIGPAQLAEWQKRLTLGPGDVLDVCLYERPETLRAGLTLGPDGLLNYLEARAVMAAGLTIDDVRDRLEQILSRYYRPPLRVIIQPQAFHSKKYYLLGNLVHPGVYPLDRPLTLIQAIAAAGGFAANVRPRDPLPVADLERSFVMRRGPSNVFERISLDFEGLFLRGDLSQDLALAPEDYLYFPPADAREVYVLGDGVKTPGVLAHSPALTVPRAIVARGGFADRAWRQRILVVRGSLNAPRTFVVEARTPGFALEPRDIVYVSARPWAKAGDLLAVAMADFLQGAVTSWTFKGAGPASARPLPD